MSDSSLTTGILPEGFRRGPYQGQGLIGEVTESIHRFLLEGWDMDRPRPVIEEDLSFVPKDRQEVVYVYMYRAAQNTALMNSKHWRAAKISRNRGDKMDRENILYERPPIYLELYYLIAVHSKFRSDAERLLGWVLLRLWEANQLIYRPRRYIHPDGTVLDSVGNVWALENDGEDVIKERVGIALVDDLPIGDAINFFTIHEAPFRPYLTYRAQCAMEGSLVAGPATVVNNARMAEHRPAPSGDRPGGRMTRPPSETPERPRIGPPGFDYRPAEDDEEGG